MSRRSLVIALHWSAVFLILTMIEGGVATPWVLWLFVGVVALWSGITLTRGLIGQPGPKLPTVFRRAYPWMHRTLHILLALTAVAIVLRLTGHTVWWLNAWTMLLVTLTAGAFHAVFHFWRHTALMDGALRLIMPRVLHKHL